MDDTSRKRTAIELKDWWESRSWERENGAPLGYASGPHPALRRKDRDIEATQ